MSGNEVKTPWDIHILTLQGHPEFSESMITSIVRGQVDGMEFSTLNDYWGPRGGDYDDEPEDKDETGRRWLKTDGKDVVSQVLRRMVVGAPPREDTEGGTALASRRKISIVSNAGPDKFSRLWILSSGMKFVSNLLRRILTVTSWW